MEQNETMRAILKNGVEAYARDIPNLEVAFAGREAKLCCMDEGTTRGDMRSAGSGILTEGAERAAFLSALKAAGIKEVTSHEGCGAASLFRKKHGLDHLSADEVAIQEAKKIAEELGVPYTGHITDLSRPKEFHNARVVYYDATGRFNPSKLRELPPGFVISRRYMTPEQAQSEVKIAASIAFGDHGFGRKFSSREPLLVVPIGDATEAAFDREVLESELTAVARELSEDDQSRVKIDGFSMPQSTLQKQAA